MNRNNQTYRFPKDIDNPNPAKHKKGSCKHNNRTQVCKQVMWKVDYLNRLVIMRNHVFKCMNSKIELNLTICFMWEIPK